MKTNVKLFGLGLIFLGGTLLSLTNWSSEKVKLPTNSDRYKVIRVNGKILFEKTKEEMKTGDYFVSGTPLDFVTGQSRAAVINNQKGQYVLKAGGKGRVKVLPATYNVSSRAGALVNSIDLKNHFSGNYLVLGDRMEVEVGQEAFPLTDSTFFYLTYNYNGELIRKKLAHHDNALVIDKNEIFQVDGEAIEVDQKEMTLYYRHGKSSDKINNFNPVFPDEEALKVELNVILDEYAEKSSEEKMKEVKSYLNDFYGTPQDDNLNSWMSKEFKL